VELRLSGSARVGAARTQPSYSVSTPRLSSNTIRTRCGSTITGASPEGERTQPPPAAAGAATGAAATDEEAADEEAADEEAAEEEAADEEAADEEAADEAAAAGAGGAGVGANCGAGGPPGSAPCCCRCAMRVFSL
jgi:hypothetical protein